ncbi:MAG: sensory histidine kinase AtoS [Candidatus Methanofastidiosum methylothiophilum]|uniref:Sensory histidine kinase AtoS n=1 Tax=Candidatus Methanofastidiosum methylothiophilum TaxID=1705564 RepID=A0A150J5Z6_9EURY|nr:MAG: sensory histidine kinase AtoS [Candidatus Methanofastidiosum methylthiophilus]
MKSAKNKIDTQNFDAIKDWYNFAVENAIDIIFIQDSNGKITYVNQTGINESGYSEEELLNMNPTQLVPPEYYKLMEDLQIKRLSGNMETLHYDMEYLKKDGKRLPVRVSSSPIIKDGKLEGVIHIVRNISEIKKTEKILSFYSELILKLCGINKMEKALEEILNFAIKIGEVDCGGIYLIDEKTSNFKLVSFKNISEETKSFFQNISPKSKYTSGPLFVRANDLTNSISKDMFEYLKEKEKLKFFSIIPFFHSGRPLGSLNIGSHDKEDISDLSKRILVSLSYEIGSVISRIRAEEALTESEYKYRELVESANSIIFVFDNNGKIISINKYGASFFGYDKAELIGKNVYDTITPKIESTGRNLMNLVDEIHTNPKQYSIHINENIKKNGEKVWVYWSNKPLYDKKGNLTSILAIGNDITENMNLQEKIKYSEIKFKSLFQNAHEAIIILNKDFLIQDINKATITTLGYPKEKLLDNMNIFDLASPLETERLKHILFKDFKNEGLVIETFFISGTGIVFPVEISFSIIEVKGEKSIICMVRDISEQKKKEEDLKKQLLKYDLDEGCIYLSKEPSDSLAFDAFTELIGVGYKGIIISREEKSYFDFEDINFEYYWLSKKIGPKNLSVDTTQLKEFFSAIKNKSVILLDSIDYLINNSSFIEVYNFINELREIAFFSKNIIIISADKNTLDPKQIRLLEKETKPIELKISESINKKLLEIIYYILNQNKLGINPSYSSIIKQLSMTRPTVRKYIRYLESNRYVIVHKKGRNKKVELTEKGKKLL